MSQRTDLAPGAQAMKQLNNADYGEQKAYQAQQAGAPMAASQGVPSGLAGLLGTQSPSVVPLGAPSGRPGENVMSAPPLPDPQKQRDMQDMINQLPVLTHMANLPGAAWGLRNLIRSVNGNS